MALFKFAVCVLRGKCTRLSGAKMLKKLFFRQAQALDRHYSLRR